MLFLERVEIMQEETKILERCERLFMRCGVKSVTMDDVSRELGISKKTLYQYFENKEDLVKKVTDSHFGIQNKMVDEITKQSRNAIDEMFAISAFMNQFAKTIHPAVLFDIKKYHPASWAIFNKYRNTDIFNRILENVERGKKEGLYREDVNADFIARVYIAKVEMFIDPDIFPHDKYPVDKTHTLYMYYHTRSIASKKGIDYLEKIKTQNYV
ncbi:MAG: TetR/AcrR family transcriptional regulator [Chitinophagales bacterium]|nr:TetR/AcrR family transcriptional regulator [Chitinophagales bacterium]